jgi:PAT family beta-lactamase induction signal transducer AmpG
MTPGTPCAGGVTGVLVQPLVHRLAMYLAILVETFCQGMATGAFGVMLLRMTQKQFSATQYALFSSIFAIGRILAGPIAGFTVDAIGWTPFFFVCTAASIPGLVLLQRFAPIGGREPALDALEAVEARPVSRARLLATSAVVAALAFAVAVETAALLAALKAVRGHPGARLDLVGTLARVLAPASTADWLRLSGLAIVGLVSGLGAAAFLMARHGLKTTPSPPVGGRGQG